MNFSYSIFETPFGLCLVGSEGGVVSSVLFGDTEEELVREFSDRFSKEGATITCLNERVHDDVRAYICDNAQKDISIVLEGTPFQKDVWHELQNIQKGETVTYEELARRIGKPKAVRAVASAVGQNPVAYLVPCHRVVRKDGGLGGYHWGIERKQAMLARETLGVCGSET